MQYRKVSAIMHTNTMAEIADIAFDILQDALVKLSEEKGEPITKEEADEIISQFPKKDNGLGINLYAMFRTCMRTVIKGEFLNAIKHCPQYDKIVENVDYVLKEDVVINAIMNLTSDYKDGTSVGLMWNVDYYQIWVEDVGSSGVFPLITLTVVEWNERGEIVASPIPIIKGKFENAVASPAFGIASVGIKFEILASDSRF